jgi:hypothetical protein
VDVLYVDAASVIKRTAVEGKTAAEVVTAATFADVVTNEEVAGIVKGRPSVVNDSFKGSKIKSRAFMTT